MSNLRFPKVFVFNPSTNMVTATNVKPPALTAPKVGFYQKDQQGVTVGGAGAAPNPNTVKRIQVQQNVGDARYGNVRTQIIDLEMVRGWFGKKASDPVVQISYIGYDEVDNDKDIATNCDEELLVHFKLWDRKLAIWYNPIGYDRNLVIHSGVCPPCGSPCTAADKEAIAAAIVAQVNGTQQTLGNFPSTSELKSFMVASVVTNGLSGDDLRVGVKLTGIAPNYEQYFNTADPVFYWEFSNFSFDVSVLVDGRASGIPVTISQEQNPGTGWAAAVAAQEAESQGYDRVRDGVTSYPFSSSNNYKFFSANGTKYDYYHLNFDYRHKKGSSVQNDIIEPYEARFIVPTGTGGTLETFVNTWLANRFPAIVL